MASPIAPRLLFSNHTPSSPHTTLSVAHHSPQTPPPSSHLVFASSRTQEPQDLHARPKDGVGVVNAAMAATAVAGISFLTIASIAVASELDGSRLSSPASVAAPGVPSLSIAVPIPHQEVWVFAQNGFIAPLPRTLGDGLVTPFPRPRNDVVLHGAGLPCPQWTPSELEMVLPDFHGRPKPFPRKGHQWPATFVVKGGGELFLQASFLEDGFAFTESEAGAGDIVGAKEQGAIGQEEGEGKTPSPKELGGVLAGAKFTCFSL